MSKTTPEQNKALVLEAFETLFNKRDYDAAARLWSDRYIQHSAHIEPGREGLFNLVRSLPDSLRPRTLLGRRTPCGVHRGRYRPNRKWASCRALGRAPGRGNPGRVKEWAADVRQPVSL